MAVVLLLCVPLAAAHSAALAASALASICGKVKIGKLGNFGSKRELGKGSKFRKLRPGRLNAGRSRTGQPSRKQATEPYRAARALEPGF